MPRKIEKRRCTICKKEKRIDKFYKTKYRCKVCMKDIITENNRKVREWKKRERAIEDSLINYSYSYI